MRALGLVVLGAIGALGVLRGLELLFVTHAMRQAIISLALGLLFIALFLKVWKKNRATQSAAR